MLAFSSCQKEQAITNSQSSSEAPDVSEKGANPDEADVLPDAVARNCNNRGGYLYTESNSTSQNEILCYKQHHDGSLTLEATVASGGNGIGPGPLNLGLDGQGALALSHNHNWLFAVNAGSNSISSFEVHNDGSITLVNTVGSNGTIPVSLCFHNHTLYVVNGGTSNNICGFDVAANGTMTMIPGSNLPLSASPADPAQIAFSPNGEYLYVTEKMTDKISSYEVDANGLATPDVIYSSTGHTPFGFCIARNFMVVSNANTVAPGVPVIGGASCTSYAGVNPGALNPVNGAVPNNQSASCWVAKTKYERFTFISNTGSNNISTYYVSPWGGIYLVHGSTVSTGAGSLPKDNVVAADNYYFYVLHTGTQEIGGYHRSFLGDLVSIGNTPNLPPFATGLVAW